VTTWKDHSIKQPDTQLYVMQYTVPCTTICKIIIQKQQYITVIAISYFIIHKIGLCFRSLFWDMTWHWLVNSHWWFGGAQHECWCYAVGEATASFTFGLAHCVTPPLTVLYYPKYPHLYSTPNFSSVVTLLGLPRPCRWRQKVTLECW